MHQDTSTRTRTLTRQEVLDLVRAGIVLAITVGAAMIVPPKVWGGELDKPAVQIDSRN